MIVAHLADLLNDALHRQARFLGDPETALHGRRRRGDQPVDFLHRSRAALRQRAHFRRHHRKAPAVFAGARRFDGGVQRKDIGLERDAFDHAGDLGDLLRRAADLAHCRDHAFDGTAAFDRGVRGIRDECVGLRGMVGVLLHGRRDLFHAGRRFFKAASLRGNTRGDVAAAGSDLFGAVRHIRRRIAHLRNDAREALADAVDRLHQAADFIGARVRALRHAHAQIARGETFGRLRGFIERTAHEAAHRKQEHDREHAHQHETDQQEFIACRDDVRHHFLAWRDAAHQPLPFRHA